MAATVDFKHSLYEKHKDQVILVNKIYDGIDTAKSLVTKLRNEYEDLFATRVEEATLDNYVERIVTTMAGQITRKPITYEEIPDNIVESMDSIAGNEDINQFAKGVAEAAIRDGKSYILVDIEDNIGSPLFYRVNRSQVTNWKKTAAGIFELVVIMEQYEIPDGRFGVEYAIQYRVIDEVGNVEIWRENADNGWEVFNSIVTSYNFCPFYEVDVDDIPPLYDIAKINSKHMNFTSLRDRFCREALDPILFGKALGLDDEGSEDNPAIIIGVNQMMSSDNPESDLNWVELDGTNYEVSEKLLAKLEEDMASRALKLSSDSKSTKTATQVSEESNESTSRLSDIATDIQITLNQAVNAYSLMLYSKELTGDILVNRDFNTSVTDGNTLTAINTLIVSGTISKRTGLKAINNTEIIEIEDIDEELTAIEEENVSMEEEVDRMGETLTE